MFTDPITEEIRSIRHALASRFNNDVSRILADVREREASDGRTYVRLPKRSARTGLEKLDATPPLSRVP
jgi:RNA binding exosome subunit